MRKDKRVVSVLFVGIIVFSICLFAAKNQVLTVNEEKNVQENDEMPEAISEEIEIEEKIELGNIKTVISPDRMSCVIALDDNGNVWQWEEGRTKEDAVAIIGIEDVVQIVDTGYNSVYALTSEGDVYAWGFNRGFLIDPKERETSVEYPEPVKLQGLSNIAKIDAANGRAFAVNDDGQLFVWGLGRYKGSREDYIPSMLEGYQELTDHVEEIYVGAGNFHYFKCEDNQIFSIISVEYISEYLKYFIVPNFQGEPSVFDWRNEIWTGNSERIFDIQEEGGFYLVYLYKMGENDNVALMGADAYTMYVYQNDGTLWYWNSDRITYHDCERMGASVELRDLDYSGFFEEVDIGSVLDMETDSKEIPAIVSIIPGEEGALFLLENGQVLVSEYVTAEIKDVEYFGRNNSNPQNNWTEVVHDFTTKKLSLRKLDFENIVNISTDKKNKFYLVDKDGNIYCYQMGKSTSEHLDMEEETETLDTEMSEEVMEQLQFWLDTYRPPLPGTEAEILQFEGLRLRMEDSCYPELREWLQQYYDQSKDYTEDSSRQVIVYRADVRALSFLETREEGSVCRGYQFDPEMGQEIALADIVHDVDRLSLIIESQLRINYPDVDFAEDMAKRLKQIWQDEEAAWTISYHGICFYIPSEMLAAKKGILLHAAVVFQDVPDLFAERYMQIPDAYTIELEDDIPLLYDIDMDGSIDRIQVFHYLQEEPKDTEIQINDKKCAGYYDDEYYDEDFRWTYLLHTAENRNYIVFWAKGDLDGSGCYGVYAVEDGKIEYKGCEEKNIDLGIVRITDPAYVRITYSSAPILTLFNFNEAVYYIDESGFWQMDNEIFYYKDSIAEIKANIELEMPLVDPYTGEMLGMEITLPKGIYMELLRTDLWTWCDFVLEDGSVCRMEFDEPFGSSNWIVEYKGVEVEGGCLSIYPSQTKENREAGQ